jgi:hypothetical protein
MLTREKTQSAIREEHRAELARGLNFLLPKKPKILDLKFSFNKSRRTASFTELPFLTLHVVDQSP